MGTVNARLRKFQLEMMTSLVIGRQALYSTLRQKKKKRLLTFYPCCKTLQKSKTKGGGLNDLRKFQGIPTSVCDVGTARCFNQMNIENWVQRVDQKV